MTSYLKLPSAKSLPKSPQALIFVVALASSFIIISIVSNSNISTIYAPTPAKQKFKRTVLDYSNYDASLETARLELGCRDIHQVNNTNTAPWPMPAVSLRAIKPYKYLPNYKNPCWKSISKDGPTVSCLPYFYIAGFPKCGTTDLHFRLVQHPLIVPGVTKEPHYITRKMFARWNKNCQGMFKGVPGKTRCSLQEYSSSYFSQASASIQQNQKLVDMKTNGNLLSRFGKEWRKMVMKESLNISHPMITVDGSASTAWDNKAWKRILENTGCPEALVGQADVVTKLNPNVRIVVILRDPTDRLYSDYLYFQKSGVSAEDFHMRVESAIQLFNKCIETQRLRNCLTISRAVRLRLGLYHIYLSDWLRLLPRSQVLVLHSETYRHDVIGTLAEVHKFLDLPALSQESMEMISNIKEKNTNKKKARVGKMLAKTEAMLRQFYEPHNEKLAKLLNDERFAWRKTPHNNRTV